LPCPTATITPTTGTVDALSSNINQAGTTDVQMPETGVILPTPGGPTPSAAELEAREQMLQGVNPSETMEQDDNPVVPPDQGATNGIGSIPPTPCP
jgi:hypothetical protein